MKRKRIVAGNWKMNKTLSEVRDFINEVKIARDNDVLHIIACPFPFLQEFYSGAKKRDLDIHLAAQDCHHARSGAYTGEVSAEMLTSVGSRYVVLGHSERRQYFNESGELLKKKVGTALESGLHIIFCCGETLDQRQAGMEKDVVLGQIRESLFHLDEDQWPKMILAYEPVWAIGTGETASPDQAEEMHAYIRSQLPDHIKGQVPVIYGGSVKPSNFTELLSRDNIDGGLIGGASLSAASYSELSSLATAI